MAFFIGDTLKLLVIFVFIFKLSFAFANELYVDCKNYCAFRDFKNNCHGIAFKKKKNNGKFDYKYTHFSELFNSCSNGLKNIPIKKVNQLCDCSSLPEIGPIPDREEPLKDATAADLIELRDKISRWAPCAPNPFKLDIPVNDQEPLTQKDLRACSTDPEGYPVLGGCYQGGVQSCTYYGNTNNYAGPFCLFGDQQMCNAIKMSQDPITGGWHRSAFQRRFIESERGQPTFSRDEFLGIMLYFVKTKDKNAAKKWMQFIEKNPKKYLTGLGKTIKVYNICPPHKAVKPPYISDRDWQRIQADDRCEMRGDSWATMYKVYRYIGFTNKDLQQISKGIYHKMRTYYLSGNLISNLSSRFVPAIGYEMGNQATNILLLKFAGDDSLVLNNAAHLINKRTGFESPYYHYLDKGPTEYGAYLIKKYCPSEQPNYQKPEQGGIGRAAASYFDSAIHYYGGIKDNWETNLPTGHECIGWINLYLQR